MRIYLDVCCLNRPFDDASQPRVAVEGGAVIALLQLVDDGRLIDYSSEMAQVEIERMPDVDRRRKVAALLPPRERIIPLSEELLNAAKTLLELKFQLADAVHLVAARQLSVDAML